MKLLIYEYVTAGGMGGADLQALLGEADAMLHALVRDFSILPDIEVHVLRCPGLPALSIGKGGESPSAPASSRTVHVHASTGTSDFARLLHHCDAALLVAPETGGILHALSSQVESLGVLGDCRAQPGLQGGAAVTVVEADVEHRPGCPGNHVGGGVADIDGDRKSVV